MTRVSYYVRLYYDIELDVETHYPPSHTHYSPSENLMVPSRRKKVKSGKKSKKGHGGNDPPAAHSVF